MTAKLQAPVNPWLRQHAPGPALKRCAGCGREANPSFGLEGRAWCRACVPEGFWRHRAERERAA